MKKSFFKLGFIFLFLLTASSAQEKNMDEEKHKLITQDILYKAAKSGDYGMSIGLDKSDRYQYFPGLDKRPTLTGTVEFYSLTEKKMIAVLEVAKDPSWFGFPRPMPDGNDFSGKTVGSVYLNQREEYLIKMDFYVPTDVPQTLKTIISFRHISFVK